MIEFLGTFIKGKKTGVDFMSLTAHQIKKPLSSIKLSLEMLSKGEFGEITKDQRDIIEKVLQKSKTLIHLADDLLNMAKVEGTGHIHNPSPVDLGALIKSAIKAEDEEIVKKGISIFFEGPKEKIPEILLDKEKIYLAMLNIIDNAVKYTPNGGKISVSLHIDGKKAEIKVQDSGIGISNGENKKIFNKFFRGENAIKIEPIGSGLGLFIAKNIIEAHKGKIWFESMENKGTAFFVKIPIK